MSESSRRSNGELSIPYIPPLAVVKRKRWWRLGDLLVTDNDDSTDNSYRWLRPKMLVLLRTSSYWMVDFCEASFIPSSCHEWHNDDIDGTSKVATAMIAIYSNPRFLFDCQHFDCHHSNDWGCLLHFRVRKRDANRESRQLSIGIGFEVGSQLGHCAGLAKLCPWSRPWWKITTANNNGR